MEKAFEELQIKDDFTRELDEAVRSARKNEKWRALNVQWTFV